MTDLLIDYISVDDSCVPRKEFLTTWHCVVFCHNFKHIVVRCAMYISLAHLTNLHLNFFVASVFEFPATK